MRKFNNISHGAQQTLLCMSYFLEVWLWRHSEGRVELLLLLASPKEPTCLKEPTLQILKT